ncbi:methylosome subunit pICln isoform X1 [Megalobrama amblycephala]|uniref:methylosome subunit pICln isoform X1 n=2 Tax=Megalobrama amblycephala TaxID=75352 RepID=UPI002013D94F|nr:methylosome subunit pICln isoform X1 [Megalobrama amblycephala]
MVVLKSLPPPSEGVRLQQAETTAVLDGKRLGSGTLFVAEAHLSWFDGSGMGFCLEYPSISLHAISRDLSAFPEEHLYVMVNAKLDDEGDAEQQEKAPDDALEDDEESDSDSEDSGTITEIRFVPSDKAALEPMFSAMCDCQALHPDPEDADTDDDDYEGEEYDVEEAEQEQGQGDVPTFYTYEEGLSHLTSEGQATLDRLEGMLAQSVAQQYHMAGVRTDEPSAAFEDGMEVDSSTIAGQFDDADVDHW